MTHRHAPSVRALALVTLALACLAPALPARAAPLYRSFGGPAGFGTGVLNRNDDGSTGAIDLTAAFSGGLRFYGGPYTQFWVNNNGNVTFRAPVGQYTPTAFPISMQPMIAPYWSDVDTRDGTTGITEPGENLVYYHLEPGRLVVTWFNVGYYASHNDLRMSFQLIITNATDCGSGDFDVEFRYDRCEWTTGDASGGMGGHAGTPAQAGFDAGNLHDYTALPGSFTASIVDVCTTSNIDTLHPGVWDFSVRAGGVVCREDMLCDVPGHSGPCSLGRTQCVMGVAMCQAITMPVAEICDGVDNDCNGTPDDAPGLCATGLTCVLGSCVGSCFEGACGANYTCDATRGVCVETACVGVTCPVNQRCVGGACVDACGGITCPHGQECISGACIDPCAAVTCDTDRICRGGICVLRCPCSPCPVGETCLADGTCLARGCDIVLCPEGEYCENSVCHDACEGVTCPRGQTCLLGRCAIPPPHDAGPPPMPDSGIPDAGVVMIPDAFMEADASHGPPPLGSESRGCGCRAGSPSERPWGAAILALGLALVVSRRRIGRARNRR